MKGRTAPIPQTPAREFLRRVHSDNPSGTPLLVRKSSSGVQLKSVKSDCHPAENRRSSAWQTLKLAREWRESRLAEIAASPTGLSGCGCDARTRTDRSRRTGVEVSQR